MSNFGFILLNILFIFIAFIIDKSFQNVFLLANYFSLTVLLLIIFLNAKFSNISIAAFFFFGLLVDWYFKSFLGLSSFLTLAVFYTFKMVKVRFSANRIVTLAINLISSFILFFIYQGYQGTATISSLVFAGIISVGISSIWLFKNL